MAAALVLAHACYQEPRIIIHDGAPDAPDLIEDIPQDAGIEEPEIPADVIEDAPAAECVAWASTYGTVRQDHALSVVQTADGGLLVAGSTESFDMAVGWELVMLKLDALGNLQWSRALPSYESFFGADVLEMPAGDFWAVGNVFGTAGYMDAVVMSFSPSGDLLWHRVFGGPLFDWAQSVAPAPEGGALVAGVTDSTTGGDSDVFLARIGGAGAVTWQKTYVHGYHDNLQVIRPVREGGFIAAGTSYLTELTPPQFWILRLDDEGGILWQRAYGSGIREELGDLIQTDDDGFVAVGLTEVDRDEVEDALVVKLDSEGHVEWTRVLGGPGNDLAFAAVQAPDGSLVVAGQTSEVVTGPPDVWVFSIDRAGNLQWQRAYGGNLEERTGALLVAPGGCLVVAGESSTFGMGELDMWILALDQDGLPGSGCPEGLVRTTEAVLKDVELEAVETAASPVAGALVDAEADLAPLDDLPTWQSQCGP